MEPQPIETDAQHEAALLEIERLWNAKPNTPDSNRLDILITLVEAYEKTHFHMDIPELVKAMKFRPEQT